MDLKRRIQSLEESMELHERMKRQALAEFESYRQRMEDMQLCTEAQVCARAATRTGRLQQQQQTISANRLFISFASSVVRQGRLFCQCWFCAHHWDRDGCQVTSTSPPAVFKNIADVNIVILSSWWHLQAFNGLKGRRNRAVLSCPRFHGHKPASNQRSAANHDGSLQFDGRIH